MAKKLVALRLDRLKYDDLSAFGVILIRDLSDKQINDTNISVALQRLQKQDELMKSLSNIKPKFTETEELKQLRKELDRYISALLLHLKAIERAAFDEYVQSIELIAYGIRFIFKNAIHEGALMKTDKTSSFLRWTKDKPEVSDALKNVGLWPYVEKLEAISKDYRIIDSERYQKSVKYPKGQKIKAKATLIEELHIFLQTVELSAALNPTKETEMLIKRINVHIKPFRAQLRNLATRRKRAKEKAAENKEKPA